MLNLLNPARSPKAQPFYYDSEDGIVTDYHSQLREPARHILSIMSSNHDSATLLNGLEAFRPRGLKDFELKIQQNEKNRDRLHDLLAEGRAALMFLRHGWSVELRDSTDPRLEWRGDMLYAEVKRFHRKRKDAIDEQAISRATSCFVKVGNTMESEGVEPWRQICNVAMKKVNQYTDDACNILVVVSNSEALELMAASAAHE